MSDMPRAREEGLVVEELDGELLVYDSQSNLAHALEGEAAAVWRACDGRSETHALAARCSISQETVDGTLARLGELGLLEDGAGEEQGRDTRRTALRKIAIGGAGLASASAVSSILVPAAATAGSCTPDGTCAPSQAQCCSGLSGGRDPIDCPGSQVTQPAGFLCCPPAGACAVPFHEGLPLCCPGSTPTPDPLCPIGFRCT